MPTYDFRCHHCGQNFSLRVAIKDREKVACPSCSGKNVEQRITGFLFIKAGGESGASSGCSGGDCSNCSGCS